MIKNCEECGHEFECYDRVRGGRKSKIKRPSSCVTCSSKCSRIHQRRMAKEYQVRRKHLKA